MNTIEYTRRKLSEYAAEGVIKFSFCHTTLNFIESVHKRVKIECEPFIECLKTTGQEMIFITWKSENSLVIIDFDNKSCFNIYRMGNKEYYLTDINELVSRLEKLEKNDPLDEILNLAKRLEEADERGRGVLYEEAFKKLKELMEEY